MWTNRKSCKRNRQEKQSSFISPYNDAQVIGGQGTIAIELMRQLDKIDAVFVPVGGGGLVSGISSYLKVHSPKTLCIGCQPKILPSL